LHPKMTSGALSEGAMMAALATLLALTGMYLPPLSLVSKVIWTIPIVVLIVRHNLKAGVISLTVAALLVMMFSNPIQAGFLVLQFGFVGLVYGAMLKRNTPPGNVILAGGLTAIAAQLAVFFLLSQVGGFSLANFEAGLKAQVEPTLQMYRSLGLIGGQGVTEEILREGLLEIILWVKLLLPGSLIAASILAALMNFLAAVIVLRKLKIPVNPLPPFREWQLPWYLAWGVIAGLGLALAGDYYQWETAGIVGKNILFIYAPFLFIFGLSVVTYFFKMLKLSAITKTIVAVLAIMNVSLTVIVVTSLGLFDALLNYRRLAPKDSP
jgi:uncharacterized protein YybS (DUF2232 family)